MTDVESSVSSVDIPNPVSKAIEANQEAEAALKQAIPDISVAQAWAAISANWMAMVDPRSPEVRRLSRGR